MNFDRLKEVPIIQAQHEQIERLRDENQKLREIEAAARNLVAVKGRHHSELAYKALEEALK